MNYSWKIIDTRNLCIGEGPIWNEKEKCLYFVDYYRFKIYRAWIYDGIVEERTYGFGVRSIVFTENGDMILISPKAIYRQKDFGTLHQIPLNTQIEHFNFNDSKVGPNGNLYIGNISEDGSGGLLKLDENGKLVQLTTGFFVSNGLDWSPDEKMFYFADTKRGSIFVYNWNEEGMQDEVKYMEPIEVIKARGIDGLTVDCDGMIWAALWHNGIYKINPITKEVIGKIELPVPCYSSCGFAGNNMDKLVVMTPSKNEDILKWPQAGNTFLIDVESIGKKPYIGMI